jgi:GntR family transcriptional regulator, transcriptional repressor for pyruvate dehydrogenase complex
MNMSSFLRSVPRHKAEYVAQRLLDRIITADLSPGTSFGTEADLLQQFDVSRPTLRESLRILESQGVLELRPGPKGGIIVTKPGMDILAHGLSVYLRVHDVPFIAVLQAREVIEPALAAAAAENATSKELAELQASVDRMKEISDQAEFIEENRIFHSIIARASRNQVMEIFWATISILATGEQHGIIYTPGNQQHIIEAHQSIVDAIRSRDSGLAAERMDSHVRELEQLVRKRYKYLLSQATSIVARQGRRVD